MLRSLDALDRRHARLVVALAASAGVAQPAGHQLRVRVGCSALEARAGSSGGCDGDG